MTANRIFLLGSYLDNMTMEETVDRVNLLIKRGVPTQHVVINAAKINMMAEDKRLQTIINQCQLINADGQSVVWAARFLGHHVKERVTGIDLFTRLIKEAASSGWRVYYLGAEKEVVRKVVSKHQEMHPELTIAGYHHGYFSESESGSVVRCIRNSRADLLFVAMSSPVKEFWIAEHLPDLGVPFVMGVGGSFDVIAGKTKRAPVWMQKSGFEWFYRFIQEPVRMFDRYMLGNLKFLGKVITTKLEGEEHGYDGT